MIQKPKGTLDLYGGDAKTYQYVINFMSNFMTLYNYEYVKIPTFESTELFIRGVGETTDVVNKETYDFKDKSDRSLTLRPEFTAGIVRMLLENKLYANETNKFYYYGSAFRYERPQNGRYREFTQFGVESFGVKNAYQDAEIISAAYNMLYNLGLENLKVKINTLGDSASRKNYKNALKEYLKDKVNNLCEDCQNRFETNPMRILDCKIDAGSEILENVPKTTEHLTTESTKYFNEVKSALRVLDIPFEEDSSLVRGLDYYTDMVFEIVYENKTLGNAGTICGGGRYDTLVEMLGAKKIPAVGFSIGIERLIILLNEEKIKTYTNQIDAYVMNLNEDNYSYEIVDMLRNNGFVVETNYLDKSLKSQFKIVDNINPKFVIICGTDESKGNYVTIKDNATKEETKVEFDELVDYLSMNI